MVSRANVHQSYNVITSNNAVADPFNGNCLEDSCIISDFIWKFGKLPFRSHLGKYFIKSGKISAKIHETGKIKAIFGLGMTPI